MVSPWLTGISLCKLWTLQDKWQIPDPPLTLASGDLRQDPIEALDLDMILLPGVAFDRSGGRLGHGKGYYGVLAMSQAWIRWIVLNLLCCYSS